MSVLSSIGPYALYHLLHKISRRSRKRTHVSFCLFVPPATNVVFSPFYAMILTIHTYAYVCLYIYIYSKESIAHQLHHLIYFHRKRGRERERKKEQKGENTLFVRSNGRDAGKFTCSHTHTQVYINMRREKKECAFVVQGANQNIRIHT